MSSNPFVSPIMSPDSSPTRALVACSSCRRRVHVSRGRVRRAARLTYVANHHEQASSIAAEAYSRIQRKAGRRAGDDRPRRHPTR